MQEAKTIDPEMTLNAVVQAWPETLSVFNLLGLDTCCGGGLPIREAAARHGLDVGEVLLALEERTGKATGAAS